MEAVQEALRDYFGTETMATVVEGALEDMAEETARDAGPKGMDRAEEINRTSDCRLLLKLVVLLVLFIVWILVIDFAGDVLIARIKAGRSVRREHRRESAGGMAIETLF